MVSNPSSNDNAGNQRVNRRDFLKLCSMVAATLSLPAAFGKEIARALGAASRLPVVWLEFQDCTGDSESFLRLGPMADPIQTGVTNPGLTDLLLDVISLDYHETLMAPSGFNAEKSLADTLQNYPGQFLCVVEGAIPAGNNGVYCTIAGKTALSRVQEITAKARATIAVGTCAWEGGLAAAAPNPTGALGVKDAVPGLANLINMPGCPMNVANLAAVIVHLVAFNQPPELDANRRPKFAYGRKIHEVCERKYYHDNDMFVRMWGDEGHRLGWCLRGMGCKGPDTYSNCPNIRWNDATCWPVAAGHGCIGCTQPHFWDNMAPFYESNADA